MEEVMSAELVENLVDFCENRARVYALLSRCYEKELDTAFAAELAEAARVFFGMGPRSAQKAFPYESVYTSEGGRMMQDAYSEVLRLYRAAGFAKDPGFTEPEDHLAVELAFMVRLCERAVEALRAGDEAAAEAALAEQRAFVRAHLLNWVPAFARDMKASAESGFYAHLATFTEAYLAADAEALAEVVGD